MNPSQNLILSTGSLFFQEKASILTESVKTSATNKVYCSQIDHKGLNSRLWFLPSAPLIYCRQKRIRKFVRGDPMTRETCGPSRWPSCLTSFNRGDPGPRPPGSTTGRPISSFSSCKCVQRNVSNRTENFCT